MSLFQNNFNSDDESSDEDYVPGVAPESGEEKSQSEEDSDIDNEGVDTGSKRKMKKKSSSSKKQKFVEKEAETEKKSVDRRKMGSMLFDQFIKGAKSQSLEKKNEEVEEKCESKPEKNSDEKLTVTKVFDFAGEKITVKKEVDINSKEGKLEQRRIEEEKKADNKPAWMKRSKTSLVDRLTSMSTKKKMTVINKSNMDWNVFKSNSKIESELDQHNRGKNSFVQRQNFLQKSDLRQHEIDINSKHSKR